MALFNVTWYRKFILTSSVEKSRRTSPCFLLLRFPAYRPNLKKLRLWDTKERLDRKHPTKEDWLSLLAHRKAAMLILHTDTQERRVLARAFISKGIGNEWFFSVLVPRIKEPRLSVFYRKSLKIFKWNHSKIPVPKLSVSHNCLVGRALDCRAGGRASDSGAGPILRVLK